MPFNGYVYFIQVGNDGPIKIGRATDPATRISDLQCSSPFRLIPRLIITGAAKEKMLHRRFKDCHIRGEWFKPRKHLRDFIQFHVGRSFAFLDIGRHQAPVARLATLKQKRLGIWECHPDENLRDEIESGTSLLIAIFGPRPGDTFQVDTAQCGPPINNRKYVVNKEEFSSAGCA